MLSLYPLVKKQEQAIKNNFDAGADRYLLRHETANISHYQKLHPAKMDLNNRLNCLKNLKDIAIKWEPV